MALDEINEEILTPSYHGEQCRHNGDNNEVEIACDNCDFFYSCFPEADDLFENPELYLDNNIYKISTSSDEVLQAFLRVEAAKENVTDEVIKLLVMEELAERREARGETPDNNIAHDRFGKFHKGLDWKIEED